MKNNKYSREIKPGVFVDVYDVLNAFKTGSAAVDHAVKKLLAPGQRGVKPREQDLKEAVASIERAIEIEKSFEGDMVVNEVKYEPEEFDVFTCGRCKHEHKLYMSQEAVDNCPECGALYSLVGHEG